MDFSKLNLYRNIKNSLAIEGNYLSIYYYLFVILLFISPITLIIVNVKYSFMSSLNDDDANSFFIFTFSIFHIIFFFIFYISNSKLIDKYNIGFEMTLSFFIIIYILCYLLFFEIYCFLFSVVGICVEILALHYILKHDKSYHFESVTLYYILFLILFIILYFITNSIILFINNRMSNLANSFLINENSL